MQPTLRTAAGRERPGCGRGQHGLGGRCRCCRLFGRRRGGAGRRGRGRGRSRCGGRRCRWLCNWLGGGFFRRGRLGGYRLGCCWCCCRWCGRGCRRCSLNGLFCCWLSRYRLFCWLGCGLACWLGCFGGGRWLGGWLAGRLRRWLGCGFCSWLGGGLCSWLGGGGFFGCRLGGGFCGWLGG